jgi:hypothetical protein
MIRRLRRLARQTLNRVERLLHPWRRRRAIRALTRDGRPGNLLVLCYGNIYRSPYAAARMRELVDEHGDALLSRRESDPRRDPDDGGPTLRTGVVRHPLALRRRNRRWMFLWGRRDVPVE